MEVGAAKASLAKASRLPPNSALQPTSLTPALRPAVEAAVELGRARIWHDTHRPIRLGPGGLLKFPSGSPGLGR